MGDEMERQIFTVGSLLTGLGVVFGAFGAHALKASLSSQMLGTFETGVRYQMYHGLGLLALAWAVSRWPERRLVPAAWLLLAGTVIFSGSLYLLVLTGARWFGAITPFGGVALIVGWGLVAWKLLAREPNSSRSGGP
jgi:uncharacterized membrane protein YgdD (TMEM256/DUF423 family)